MPEEVYNPLDKKHLAESIETTILRRDSRPLADIPVFDGAGIYIIYYHGPFPAYADVVREGLPIYVGKAVPAGGRRGRIDLSTVAGPVLSSRLIEHRETIVQSSNLEVDDFTYRYLVVDDIWIPLGESILIQRFRPLWNQNIAGFGNHDPGSGRYQQRRSVWDTIHPGRAWAMKCRERPDAASIIERWSAPPT